LPTRRVLGHGRLAASSGGGGGEGTGVTTLGATTLG